MRLLPVANGMALGKFFYEYEDKNAHFFNCSMSGGYGNPGTDSRHHPTLCCVAAATLVYGCCKRNL